MTHPTDEELEALAQRLELVGPTDVEVVDMLRACKGQGWQPMESAPIFGRVLRYDPRRREGEQVFECAADGGFWRHEKVPGMWMHMPVPPGTAPDHETWNAAIEVAVVIATDWTLGPEEIAPAIRKLKKGPSHD